MVRQCIIVSEGGLAEAPPPPHGSLCSVIELLCYSPMLYYYYYYAAVLPSPGQNTLIMSKLSALVDIDLCLGIHFYRISVIRTFAFGLKVGMALG